MPPDFLPIESNNKDTEQVSSNLKKSAVDMEILNLIGRSERLFDQDIQDFVVELGNIIRSSRILVVGGAGSIGQAVTKEISAESQVFAYSRYFRK